MFPIIANNTSLTNSSIRTEKKLLPQQGEKEHLIFLKEKANETFKKMDETVDWLNNQNTKNMHPLDANKFRIELLKMNDWIFNQKKYIYFLIDQTEKNLSNLSVLEKAINLITILDCKEDAPNPDDVNFDEKRDLLGHYYTKEEWTFGKATTFEKWESDMESNLEDLYDSDTDMNQIRSYHRTNRQEIQKIDDLLER